MPIIATLDEGLRTEQTRWKDAPRHEKGSIYYRGFITGFRKLFAALPLDGSPNDMPKPTALVSVLGLSWQPVALMAAWVCPERVLVLGTDDALGQTVDGDAVTVAIPQAAGVAAHRFEWRRIPDPGEEEIYREVRDFIARHSLDSHLVALDPTGGKKSMSCAASLAGFLAGVRLVYVDYHSYEKTERIPLAGTEYPRLLSNPLEVFGDVEISHIVAAFNRGDFSEAERRASELVARLYEPREAETIAILSRAYGEWDRFHFDEAQRQLSEAAVALGRFGKRWPWAAEMLSSVNQHSQFLSRLAGLSAKSKPKDNTVGQALLLNHLASAQRAARYGQFERAILLAYGTIERCVDWLLWDEYGIDADEPDYDAIDVDMDSYHQAGRDFHNKSYRERELSGSLMYSNGIQLLAALKPDSFNRELLGQLKGLSEQRNRLPVEHGLVSKPLLAKQVDKQLTASEAALSKLCAIDRKALASILVELEFPDLNIG